MPKIFGEDIPFLRKAKYLGFQLDKKLNLNAYFASKKLHKCHKFTIISPKQTINLNRLERAFITTPTAAIEIILNLTSLSIFGKEMARNTIIVYSTKQVS